MNIESSLKRGQMAAIMTIVNDINKIGLPRSIVKWEAEGCNKTKSEKYSQKSLSEDTTAPAHELDHPPHKKR